MSKPSFLWRAAGKAPGFPGRAWNELQERELSSAHALSRAFQPELCHHGATGQSQPCCHLRALNKAGREPRASLALSRERITELPARSKGLCTSGSCAGNTWLSWLSPRHGDSHQPALCHSGWAGKGQPGAAVCTQSAGSPVGSGNCFVGTRPLRTPSLTGVWLSSSNLGVLQVPVLVKGSSNSPSGEEPRSGPA